MLAELKICATFALAKVKQNSDCNNAKIAQLVDRHLAKVEVAGSNPVFRSTLPKLLEWWNW